MFAALLRLVKDEDGPTAVEYAVMLMLIVVACVGAVQLIATALYDSFTNSSDAIGTYL